MGARKARTVRNSHLKAETEFGNAIPGDGIERKIAVGFALHP